AFNDSPWLSGSGGVGYERRSGYETLFTIDVQSQMYNKAASCYIRIPFTVSAQTLQGLTSLVLKVRYDDGFVAYLNGTEVQRALFTGTPAWNSTASTRSDADAVVPEPFDISSRLGLLHAGTNLLAIHAMNDETTSSDFLNSATLEAVGPKAASGSARDNDLKLLDGLRITELMYRAPKGSTYDYVELQNVIDEAIDVTGVRFDKGIDFVFSALTLQPGECVVVVANQSSFRSQYGATPKVAGQYKGNLSDSGEKIVLLLPSLEVAILRFEYSSAWYPATDGGGKSLTIQDPAAAPVTWNDAESWHAAEPTPGRP
ncbi:MAG: lamin tail domain-containing protein, partial [Planctomycetes bacterium]|nr:lamin tail domain-containing protein [Planctomycetota bacterium]